MSTKPKSTGSANKKAAAAKAGAAAKKAPKKKAAGKTIGNNLFLGEVPLSTLSDWPELAALPTLDQAAAMDPESEAAAQWSGLTTSLREHGQIERLRVVPNPAGGWWVVEGRSRRAGIAKVTTREPDACMVKVEEVAPEVAAVIAVESLRRRMVKGETTCYLRCLAHADELLSRGRGRPKKGEIKDDSVTQAKLAEDCRVSSDVVSKCLKAIRYFRDHPEARAAVEPKIMAGITSITTWEPAVEGLKNKGTARPAAQYHMNAAKSWRGWVARFDAWAKWPAAQREETLALVRAEAVHLPGEICAALKEGGSK